MTPRTLSRLVRFATALVLVALAAGCTRDGRKAGILKKADAYYVAGDFDKAEIEYKNALQTAGLDAHAIGRLGAIYLEQGRGPFAYSYLVKASELDPANLDVRVKLAVVYAASGKPNEARDAVYFVLEKRPNDPDAPVILAETALQPREVDETRTRLQTLPPTASILASLAMLEMREKKLPAAETLLNRALELDPKSPVALSTLARLHWTRNELEQAEQRFAAAVAASPARSQVKLLYAGFKLQTGKNDAAKALLDELIAKTPDFLQAYMMRAAIATLEKKHAESIAIYEKVLQRDNQHPEAMLLLGQEHLALGAADKAVAALEKAVGAFSKFGPAHLQLGNAYLASGDLTKAAASYGEAIQNLPAGTPEPVVALARVQLRQNNYGPAVEALKPVVEKHPTNTEAKLLLAEGLQKQGNFDAALALYRPLLEATPQNAQLHHLIGTVFLQQGKRTEARQAFTKVLELAPTFIPALEFLVRLDLEAKEIDAAVKRLKTFATANPKEPEPHVMLAQVHLLQKNRRQAEADLLKALELRPDLTRPYLVLAELQASDNRAADAIATLKKAVAQVPTFAEAHLTLGLRLEQQKDYAAARASYEKVLELDPKAAGALNNLAYLLAERFGDVDRALDLAQRAREALPNNPAVADTLGWMLYKKKQYARAVSVLDESAAKLPQSGEARYHAGMAHYMMGNEATARAALRQSLELEASFTGRDDASQSLAILDVDVVKEGEAARARIEQALVKRPDDPIALQRLALLNERSGKLDQAVATYENVLKANPANVGAALNLIRIYRSRNEAGKALELAKSTRRLAPNDGKLAHVLGRLAFENGEHAVAVGVLQDAVRRLENDPEARFDLAEAAYSTGQIAAAENAAQDALQSTATFSRATQARQFVEFVQAASDPAKAAALGARADALLKSDPNHVPALMVKATAAKQQGDAKSAREACEKALARYPEFTPAHRTLAILLSATPADAKRGVELATKARTAFPADAELAKAFGVMLYHQGNFTRASTMLQESARTRTEDAEVQYYLGLAQRQLKDPAASTRALERAVELGLPANLATEARKLLAEGKSGKK